MKYYEGYEEPDDVMGYVYLFKCGVHYKIGFSKHPELLPNAKAA